MSEETVEVYPSSTIKFGAGFDTPQFTARGTVAQQWGDIREAFGLEKSKAGTLAELLVEASLHAHALVNAATIGAKPAPSAQNANTEQADTAPAKKAPAKKAAARKSIADKKRSSQPEENTDDIEALIAGASTVKQLNDIYRKHKASVTDEQLELFAARKAELQEQEDK